MHKQTRFARLALFVAVWLVFGTACGDEECERGTTECLSDNLIRTCLPGEDGNVWLVSQCGANFSCLSDPSRLIRSNDEDDAGIRVGHSDMRPSKQPACVGCDVGAHECLSDALARFCVSGGIWQLDPCDVGERCADSVGVCRVGQGDGTVQACEPGAMACASKKVAKVCDADGTAWIEQPCATNERCEKDHCEPDPESACDKGDSCLNGKTAVQCLSRSEGYKVEECTGDLYCENGRCRGPVCAVGATCVEGNQVRECVGGNSYKDTQCGVNEVCMRDHNTAKCVARQCTVGKSSCGDPRDSSVDMRKYFTACVMGEGSGVPEWVRGECAGATSCDPALAMTSNPCSQQCTKGAQRCASDALSGVNDGIQTCGDDGKWGTVKTCNSGADGQLQCAMQNNPNASELPKAVCAEPICQWAWTNPKVGAEGACEGAKLRKCQDDGKLAAASSCKTGVCQTLRSVVTADGRTPGACNVEEQCKDGEEECVDAGDLATPRYRTCQNGAWNIELKTCKNDALCFTGRTDKGLRRALCGAQCSPGARRCNEDGSLEVCEESGRFGAGAFCEVGVCKALGNHDAACVLECMPGTRTCAGTSGVMAADGYHLGYSQERVCNEDGRLGDATACPTDTVCRVSGANVTLGCVACIGSKVPGGNEERATDSRCEPNNAKNLQECSADNTWASGRACTGSKMCVNPASGSCGTCKVSNMDIVCTQANIVAINSSATCESLSFGAPGSWAGVDDCCANYHKGQESTSSFAYCQ
ncbi:MAG TPA: hypothetical protein VFN67_32725 [Polyangiales bacterium]|nr:hypothetical protein [Polyangiales bacterium]